MKRKAQLCRLFNLQSGKCAYCHEPMTLSLNCKNTATRDHVIPKSKLKISDIFNMVAACSTCNSLKADLPLTVFMGILTRKHD